MLFDVENSSVFSLEQDVAQDCSLFHFKYVSMKDVEEAYSFAMVNALEK